MHLITHFLISWNVADLPKTFERRDSMLITLAGISPDIDGLGAPLEILTRDYSNPVLWFSEYHHKLHSLTFALIIVVMVILFAKRKVVSSILSFFVFHIHLLGDIIGARGPDGYQWPIPYLFPFSDLPQLQWTGQWALNGWQNILITLIFIFITFKSAYQKGYSPIIFFSLRADKIFVETLRKRFMR